MTGKDVLGKPYVVLSIMALFFFIAINLPRILHPMPSGEIAPPIFPRIYASVKCISHGLVVNITNGMNKTVLIYTVSTREHKIYVNKTLLPQRFNTCLCN